VTEVLDAIEQRLSDSGACAGTPYGFADLDAITSGLQRSDLVILAARTAVGKTAFALNVFANICLHNAIPALFFSLEMSRHQLIQRLVSMIGRFDSRDLREPRQDTRARWDDLYAAGSAIARSPFLVDDAPALDIADLRSRARYHKTMQPKLALIVVDYLQLITTGRHGQRRRNESRQEEVARISAALKALARELNIPVLALAQLSREAEKRARKNARPRLSDLRESGAIEQDADVVLILHRPNYYSRDLKQAHDLQEIEVIVAKHRNGPTGLVDLLFDPKTTAFKAPFWDDEK